MAANDIGMQQLRKFIDQNLENDGCWEWPFGLCGYRKGRWGGYGRVWLDGKNRLVHRVMWFLSGRSTPSPLVLDHTCENKKCANVAHLRLLTRAQNTMACSRTIGRVHADRKVCKWGHELTSENVLIIRGHHRSCRKCASRRVREFYQRKEGR